MLNDYEIKKFPHGKVLVAISKLCFSIIVLYSAILIVPELVGAVQAEQQLKTEPLKIRVVANSSSEKDQQLKQLVVENIQTFVKNNVNEPQGDQTFQQLLENVQIEFPNEVINLHTGDNLFPPKLQFATFYPQNFYNSVVFVIGEGRGENWFCAVFATVCDPPQKQEKGKMKFFIYEWIKEKVK